MCDRYCYVIVNTAAGNINVALTTPGATDFNRFTIKKSTSDGNSVTLTPASGLIDGAASYTWNDTAGTSGESRDVYFDGTNWWLI